MNSDFQLAKENFDKGSKSFNDGLYLEAEKYFNLSIKYLPDRVSTLSSLLIVKISLKKINECEEIISKINKIDKDYPYGIYAKALYYGSKLDFIKSNEELLSIINKENLSNKDLSTFYNCLGTNYAQLSNNKKSIQCHLKAIDLNSENNEAYFNLGTRYLHENNFKDGWKYYEYRLKKNNLPHDKYPIKIEDITKKKVLIRHEQGFGDTIQFSRLLNHLSEYSKDIDFLIPESLKDLFDIKNVNIIYYLDDNTNYDYEIYLMSLPYFLNIDLADPPKISHINEDLLKKSIKKNNTLKIGLAWSGNKNYNFDILRSLKLSYLKKILDLKDLNNINFYCLQKDIRKIDQNYFKELNINYLGDLKFANLAKEIVKMDLVISSDTSILHLSSSLGVKTYGLLPFAADWRWADNEIKTNWYESLEIFRLKKDQSWENLSKKIADKIKEIK